MIHKGPTIANLTGASNYDLGFHTIPWELYPETMLFVDVAILNHVDLSLCQIGHLMIVINQEV